MLVTQNPKRRNTDTRPTRSFETFMAYDERWKKIYE